MARILFIGDSPEITSGFGICNRMFVDALMAWGHDVTVLACLMTHPVFDSKYKMWYVDANDPMGHKIFLSVVNREKPDLIVMHGDPGTLYERMAQVAYLGGTVPVVAIYPIEGAPVHDQFIRLQKMVSDNGIGLTYTEKGADLVEAAGVPRPSVQTLGWNHSDFMPLPENVRNHLRMILGLSDTFLVGQVAYNKRGNRQPAMIMAAKLLEDRGLPISMYLHTNPDEGSGLQGWPLNMVVHQVGATNVMFKPERRATFEGVAYNDSTDPDEYLKLEAPTTEKGWLDLFGSLPLGVRYGLFDLYVDNSSVQGYNLPSAEAMACGVPLVSVNDDLARTEIFGAIAYAMMEPDAVDWWHTTATLQLVSPETIADTIEDAYKRWKEHPKAWQMERTQTRKDAVEHLLWNTLPLMDAVQAALELKKNGPKQVMFQVS